MRLVRQKTVYTNKSGAYIGVDIEVGTHAPIFFKPSQSKATLHNLQFSSIIACITIAPKAHHNYQLNCIENATTDKSALSRTYSIACREKNIKPCIRRICHTLKVSAFERRAHIFKRFNTLPSCCIKKHQKYC